MKENFLVSGIHVGEHSFIPAELTKEFEARGVQNTSFLTIRTRRKRVEPEYFYQWAEWCREHKVYFMYLYTIQNALDGTESHLTPEITANVKKIAGEYFMGDQIGEVGTIYGARPRGYGPKMPVLDDMKDCRDYFLSQIKKYVDIDKKMGVPNIVPVEATAMLKYTYDAGGDIILLEMMPGDPEFLVSLNRGCAHAYGHELWGTYVAQEWYGGIRNDDPLKEKRLKVAYGYTYLSGSHIICLESGDEKVQSYGYNFESDHPVCRAYRKQFEEYESFIRKNTRIAPEPEAKVAFVYGNLDAYTGYMGTSVWEQYDRPEWSWGQAEWSWRILEDMHHARSWQDIENYGEKDFSFAPAYGLYDVIPADTPADKMAKYDTVIFVGWNSMTDEIWANLKKFVSGGGHLFITAAHFNTNTKRDGKYLPINNGKMSDFTGFDIKETYPVNLGVKFVKESLRDGVVFPVMSNGDGDPIMAGGRLNAVETDISTAQTTAIWHDSFYLSDGGEIHPAVLENKYGDGVVTVLLSRDYPGQNGVYPVYRTIVRELVTASHRNCDVKVNAGDKLKFSVYRGEDKDMICLLNTDFTNPVTLTISAHGKSVEKTLEPCELAIEFINR
ncbi:MAG: hypothetical protein E7588_03465 [Ruminococcaceae bacterium]|nr:hypothetical protein [Oscillospiraceae bacterium]